MKFNIRNYIAQNFFSMMLTDKTIMKRSLMAGLKINYDMYPEYVLGIKHYIASEIFDKGDGSEIKNIIHNMASNIYSDLPISFKMDSKTDPESTFIKEFMDGITDWCYSVIITASINPELKNSMEEVEDIQEDCKKIADTIFGDQDYLEKLQEVLTERLSKRLR